MQSTSTVMLQPDRPLKGFNALHLKYNIFRKIGEGSYGKVYPGRDKITGEVVAIKKIDRSPDFDDTKRILREVSILHLLKGHPNIISLKYIVNSTTRAIDGAPHHMGLVFEHCETDLGRVIASKQPLTEAHLNYFLYQISRGVYFIHSANMVHRDLKPANILVNRDCSIKIADFGLARANHVIRDTRLPLTAAPQQLNQLTEYVITRWYRGPEVILNRRAEEPADMWSIGCIFAELYLREALFRGAEDNKQLMRLILELTKDHKRQDCEWIVNERTRHSVTTYVRKSPQTVQQKFKDTKVPVSASGFELLEALLEFNPTKRITAEHVLRHPCFEALREEEPPLPFSLDERSAIDKRLIEDYHQFETELDAQPNGLPISDTMKEKLSRLIQKEVDRYSLEPAPPVPPVVAPMPPAAPAIPEASSSALIPGSFFQPSSKKGSSAADGLDKDYPSI
jgi:serine/threonine protein kinase